MAAHIKKDAPAREAFSAAISVKLEQLLNTSADKVLTDYLLVMLMNQKSAAAACTELAALITSEPANELLPWLIARPEMVSAADAESSEPAAQQLDGDESTARPVHIEGAAKDHSGRTHRTSALSHDGRPARNKDTEVQTSSNHRTC